MIILCWSCDPHGALSTFLVTGMPSASTIECLLRLAPLLLLSKSLPAAHLGKELVIYSTSFFVSMLISFSHFSGYTHFPFSWCDCAWGFYGTLFAPCSELNLHVVNRYLLICVLRMRKEQVIHGMPLRKRIPLECIPAVCSILTRIGRNRTKKAAGWSLEARGLIANLPSRRAFEDFWHLTFPQALCETKASDLEWWMFLSIEGWCFWSEKLIRLVLEF